MKRMSFALIADDNYVVPTCTTIQTIVENCKSSKVCIYIISAEINEESKKIFLEYQTERVDVIIIDESVKELSAMHVTDTAAICVASEAALLKFKLPQLLEKEDKVLYIDGDTIVREDLLSMFERDISEVYAAVVKDSGGIYYKHEYVKKCKNYFNSGVMLLNLKKMRDENVMEKLIDTKRKSSNFSLMDQNVFNLVFDGKVILLPIRYNVLYSSLVRAKAKYSIEQVNDYFGVTYKELSDIASDAAIIHFSAKDKPWLCKNSPLQEEWQLVFERSAAREVKQFFLTQWHEDGTTSPYIKERKDVLISVIIPVYNVEKYIEACLKSVLAQGGEEIEVICVDDGSSDRSLKLLQKYALCDERVSVIPTVNGGQSKARNIALSHVSGKYVYFMDSDDILQEKLFQTLLPVMEADELDMMMFDAIPFYDDKELEKTIKRNYSRREELSDIYSGSKMLQRMVEIKSYQPSPCLYITRTSHLREQDLRFHEGIIHEDNLFTFMNLMSAKRTSHRKMVGYLRRIRMGSTVTNPISGRNLLGYFICYNQISAYSIGAKVSDDVAASVLHIANSMRINVLNYYKDLVDKEDLEAQMSVVEWNLLQHLIVPEIEVKVLETRQVKLSCYKRKVMAIRGKLRGLYTCYREHGIKYTLREVMRSIFKK